MEGIKFVNLIETGPVVIEIQGVENGELAVPVNNTLVSHTAFLAADTQPCVLICAVVCRNLHSGIFWMLKYHNFISVWGMPPDPHIWDYLLSQTRTPLLKSLRTGLPRNNQSLQLWPFIKCFNALGFQHPKCYAYFHHPYNRIHVVSKCSTVTYMPILILQILAPILISYQYQYSPSAYVVKIESSQEVHFTFVNNFYKFYWPKNWFGTWFGWKMLIQQM